MWTYIFSRLMYLFSSKNYRFCEIDLFNKKRQEKNENEDSELPDIDTEGLFFLPEVTRYIYNQGYRC